MRILFTIPHFYKPTNGKPDYGSQSKNPQPRIQALSQCICALHQLFGSPNHYLSFDSHVIRFDPINEKQSYKIDIVICTTEKEHLLNKLNISQDLYIHNATKSEPMFLGFECQKVLSNSLDKYDYYCYLEDDLIIHDPYFFQKLLCFTNRAGQLALLQPNRYEVSMTSRPMKAYIDGDLAQNYTDKFQDISETPTLIKEFSNGETIVLQRTSNPHSGCYFLTIEQMNYWSKQPYFGNKDTSFVRPLESAATLGIMRTFKIYKPSRSHASFLEIQHFGQKFIDLSDKQYP